MAYKFNPLIPAGFCDAGPISSGSGTDTYVAYWTGTDTLSGDAGLTYSASTDTLSLVGSVDGKRLILKEYSSQTDNILEFQNSSGNATTVVQPGGHLKFGNTISGLETNAARFGARIFDNYLDIVGIAPTASSSGGRVLKVYDVVECGRFQGSAGDGYLVFNRASAAHGIYFGENGDSGDVFFRGTGRVTVSTSGDQFDGRFTIAPATSSQKVLIVRGVSSQTGQLVQLQGRSSTTEGREQMEIDTAWADSTDASRKARGLFRVWDTAAREAMRIEASGSAAMIGFLGASAVARQTTYTQTYSTATATHANFTSADLTGISSSTTGTALAEPSGTYTQSEMQQNFRRIQDQFNLLRADVANLKQVVNTLIDDSQAYGLAA